MKKQFLSLLLALALIVGLLPFSVITASAAAKYKITVNNGEIFVGRGFTSSMGSAAEMTAGNSMRLVAAEMQGKIFAGWEFAPSISQITDAQKMKSTIDITMPSHDLIVTAKYVDLEFRSLYPEPTAMELINHYTDLYSMDLGTEKTNLDFYGYPKDLPAQLVSAGWTTYRRISVTRDGDEIYSRSYADSEKFGWNLKNGIDQGGTYVITLGIFAKNGDQIVEKNHKYRVYVSGAKLKSVTAVGVGTPVIGKLPSTVNTVKSNTNGAYVDDVEWQRYDADSYSEWVLMTDGEVFKTGERYLVTITFRTKDGYSFDADASNMSAYINGVQATVIKNAHRKDRTYVDLEFTPITDPAFTKKPVDGEVISGEKLTVDWALNFAPTKIALRKSNRLPNGRVFHSYESLDVTATSVEVASGNDAYAICAYYNDTDYVAATFHVTEADPAFTKQPVGGEVSPGQKLTVIWKTNFIPLKLELRKKIEGPVRPFYAIEVLDVTASSAEVAAEYDSYTIRAYYTDSEYVDSTPFSVTEKEESDNIAVKCIGTINYTVNGNVVTVKHDTPCKLGYQGADGKYVTLKATKNADGSYTFTAPAGVTEVLLAAKGDITGDGKINVGDVSKLYAHVKKTGKLTGDILFVADISDDNKINVGDVSKLYAHVKKSSLFKWDT